MAGELLIYCIAFLLSIIAVQTDDRSAPIISSVVSSPENGFFYPGDSLTFTCTATGSPTPRYTLLHNGAVRVQNQVSGVFTVSSASATDVGNYECQAMNQWGTAISSTVVMTLAFINDFTDRSTKQASTIVGASTSLECRSAPASAPPSLYSWAQYASNTDASPVPLTTDARRQIDQSTGTIYFANAVLADRANAKPLYACQANIATTIKVGSYWNWAITGTTASPVSPSRAFRNPKSDQVTVLKGQSAPFKCFFYGFPTPVIIWSRSSGALNTSQISEFNTSYTIDAVQESDDGVTITCIPSNSPSTNFAFTLVVDIIPEFNANNSGPAYINGSDGDTVSFQCNAHSKPTATVTWYINGSALATPLPPRYVISSDTFNLTISNITNNDTSVVTCKAENTHGSSLAQGGLIVLKRTTVSTSPTNQSVPLGQSAKFSCGASVDPATPAKFTWLHNGDVVNNSADMSAYCGAIWCDLNIAKVQEIHAGDYECIVTNDYSEASSTVAYLDVLPAIEVFSAASIWYVFLIIGLLFLILILVVFLYCYCKDNDGDSYPVDEMETKNGNNPEKELRDTGFKDFDPPPLTTGQVWTTGAGAGFISGPGSRYSDNGSVAAKYRADPAPMTMSEPPPPVYSLQQNVGYAANDSSSTLQRNQYGPAAPIRSRPQTPRSPTAGFGFPVAPALRSPPYQPQQPQLWIDEQPEHDVARPIMFSSFQPANQDQYYPDEEFDDGRRDVRGQPPPPESPVARYDNVRIDPRSQYVLPQAGDPYQFQYGGAMRAPSESSV